jgi:hypothetical protein
MRNDEMGEACDMHGAEQKCMEGCQEETLREVAA